MSVTMKELGIDRLSVQERLALADEILSSIAGDPGGGSIPDWHFAELRRLELIHAADPTAGTAWEDVMARVGKRTKAS
jgi:putative addiction module component (TIGR02574 family)